MEEIIKKVLESTPFRKGDAYSILCPLFTYRQLAELNRLAAEKFSEKK